MRDILIATHNLNKRNELKSLLNKFPNLKILYLDDLNVSPPVIIEDGKTFRQNAVKKAVITSKFFDGLALADDSGLEVDALHGRPGVRSARFARANATDKENTEKLLTLMKRVPTDKRKARFICHISLALGGELLGHFIGTINGYILERAKGKNGFGYDPVFLPEGHDKSFAEMAASYKNRISHRAVALNKLKEEIDKYL